MERRSFLKLLGVVTGGALLPLHLVRGLEEPTYVTPAEADAYYKSLGEFFFELDGMDFGPWVSVLEPPLVQRDLIDVTTFDSPGDKKEYIPGLSRLSARLQFEDLPSDRVAICGRILGEAVPFRLGHRPSGWSWSGQCYLSQYTLMDGRMSMDFIPTGAVQIHSEGGKS